VTGTSLGPYFIVAKVGEGGMGEVYRARDTRLGREVAVKVLTGDVAGDPERRARFEREARAVAALDHPHICGIYDVGEASGTHYLVMPLIEGQTLATRLEKGPLPIAQALKVAGEIADALDKAHRHGIVHRDLKPANMMLTKAGVKLLDFGLAKLRPARGAVALSGAGSQMATTTAGTAEGTILGTIHYMAPEQVEGKEADHRADIWALGVVLYEMVTGVRPFKGETAASVLGAILKEAPQALSARQSFVPAGLASVVAGALEKDADRRWQSAADVGRLLREVVEEPQPDVNRPPSWQGRRIAVAGWATAAAILVYAAWPRSAASTSPPAEAIRFDVVAPEGTTFSAVGDTPAAWPMISPDGTTLVVAATRPGVRRLNATEAVPVRGSEDARFPFWSPDSRKIGFFSGSKLKTVDLAGSEPVVVADVLPAQARGGAWNAQGQIVFTPSPVAGLSVVNADGSGLRPVTVLDETAGETSHRWPAFLPDSRHFVYAARGREDTQGVYLASLDGPVRKRLLLDLSSAAVDPTGQLLLVRDGTLVSIPFDLTRFEVSGQATPVATNVTRSPSYYFGAFSLAGNGTLAYGSAPPASQMQWMDRRGAVVAKVGPPGEYIQPRPSPDDSKIAVARLDPERSAYDLWVVDTSRGDAMTRLTYNASSERFPVWSPDGASIAYSGQSANSLSEIFVKPVGGTADDRKLVAFEGGNTVGNFVSDWSSDGKTLLFSTQRPDSLFDLESVEVASGRRSPVLRTPFAELQPQLSPDRRWLAYASDESGQFEVFVRPFPAGDRRWPVSTAGGQQPRWRADGRELFYMGPDGTVMAVPVTTGATFSAGLPTPLFRASVSHRAPEYGRDYAVSRDGQRVLVNWAPEGGSRATVVVNWRAALNGQARPTPAP
jgi:eukaryotic-like serine/threonine-protein kinase